MTTATAAVRASGHSWASGNDALMVAAKRSASQMPAIHPPGKSFRA